MNLVNLLQSSYKIFLQIIRVLLMIGLIVPPAEIKKLVQKTAQYVAENGSEFQKLVLEKQQNDLKFSFLRKQNPYRNYYDHMVNEFSKQIIEQAQQVKQQNNNHSQFLKEQEIMHISTKPIEQQQKAFFEKAFQQIKAPDAEVFYTDYPQKMTLAQRDFIQHTAQYVARNGKNFLVALNQRQKNNPQFEFLKTTSDQFKYFMNLVDGYTKILTFKNTDIEKLVAMSSDKYYILEKCIEKFEYEKIQEQSKNKKVDNRNDKDLNIDWNDFELVETIVFDDDNIIKNPNAMKDQLSEIMKRKIMQMQTNNYEKPIEQITLTTSKKKQVLQQCSVCDRHIPASQMNHHLKLCMMDPKYKEKREQQLRKKNQTKYAGTGLDINQNLNNLKSKRPDIFGSSQDTFQLEQNTNQIKTKQEKIIWDGQATNMTRTTATIAMMANQQKKLMQEIKNQHKK